MNDFFPAEKDRTIHTFTIPASLAHHDTKTVGLVELSTEEEMMAQKRAPNDVARMTYELTKASLREVNGKRVSLGDGSADRAWSSMHPKVRTLVVTAYNNLHNPSPDESRDFFSSRQTTLG
jgi:hypothetical protein